MGQTIDGLHYFKHIGAALFIGLHVPGRHVAIHNLPFQEFALEVSGHQVYAASSNWALMRCSAHICLTDRSV